MEISSIVWFKFFYDPPCQHDLDVRVEPLRRKKQTVKVGVKTGQGGYSYEELVLVWRKAEEIGFDSAWLYDHFIALGNPKEPCLEAYTTLGALARDTNRIHLGVMATCANYRNPALLGKMTSTLDNISRGRVMLGIGAGWYEYEYRAYGYEYPPDRERIQQLKETIGIVKELWTRDSASVKGKHYSVQEAPNLPKPIQKHIPILVGISKGTRVLPRIAVREADGFNTVSEPSVCNEIIRTAEDERSKQKRNRSELTYSVQAFILMGTDSQIEKIVHKDAAKEGKTVHDYVESLRKRWIVGAPHNCAERLREYTKMGVDYLLLIVGGDRLGWPLEAVKDQLIPLL